MIIIRALLIHMALTFALARPTTGKYTEHVAFVIRAFTPPRSLFLKRELVIDDTNGEKYQKAFQKAYGKYGEDLVRAYGFGLTKGQLLKHGLL